MSNSSRKSGVLPELIIKIRESKGMSREDLSIRTGLSDKYVRGLERGSVRPNELILNSIAKALETSAIQLGLAMSVGVGEGFGSSTIIDFIVMVIEESEEVDFIREKNPKSILKSRIIQRLQEIEFEDEPADSEQIMVDPLQDAILEAKAALEFYCTYHDAGRRANYALARLRNIPSLR